jgi:hypothetical protein
VVVPELGEAYAYATVECHGLHLGECIGLVKRHILIDVHIIDPS